MKPRPTIKITEAKQAAQPLILASGERKVMLLRLGPNEPEFAVRVFEPRPSRIKTASKLLVMDGAWIGCNVEQFDGTLVRCWPFSKPVRVYGIVARFKAEVWGTWKDEPRELKESWFAMCIPQDYKTLPDFILDYLDVEAESHSAEATKRNPPIVSEKSSRKGCIDHRTNARKVAEGLLREEYPRFFRAMDTRREADEVRKAYIADLWALRGRAPDAENLDALARDSGFTRWLADALGKPGRTVPDWQWAVTLGWIPKGYYCMEPVELAKTLNKRTGLKLSTEAWRKRIKRMKLENTLKLGRPENSNSLPPG